MGNKMCKVIRNNLDKRLTLGEMLIDLNAKLDHRKRSQILILNSSIRDWNKLSAALSEKFFQYQEGLAIG